MNNPKFNPYNWQVVYHNDNGTWDKNAVIHLEPEQEKGYINGEVLAEIVKEKSLNADVLGYLLEHQDEIPKEWNDKYVYFFGTILLSSSGYRFVLCLYRNDGGRWRWNVDWLGYGWGAERWSVVSSQVSSSLESAIKTVKEAGYKIIKEI